MINDRILKIKEIDEKRFKLFKKGEIFDDWAKYFFEDQNVSNRKETGSFYTPEWIVRIMVERTLNYFIDKNIDISNIKILEPSVGTGNFVDVLIDEINKKTGKPYKKIVENISVIDVNNDSLTILKQRIVEKYDVEITNVFNEDALSNNTNEYDLIIGNPPYGNLLSKEYKEKNSDKYNNIALTFLSIFQNKLSDNGILYFIVPHSFSRSGSGSEIWRKEVKDNKSLYEIIDVGNPFFDITLEQIIVGLNKKENLEILSGSIRRNEAIRKISISDFYSEKDVRMIIYFDDHYKKIMNNYKNFPFDGKRGKDYKKQDLESEKRDGNYFLVGGKNISKRGLVHLKNYDKFVSDSTYVLDKEEVAITQFGTNLKASILKPGVVPSGGVVIIRAKELKNEEIVGFLNRNDVEEFLRKYILNYAELTVHLDSKYINQIPYFL